MSSGPGLIDRLLEHPLFYAAWQNSHNRQKTEVILNEIRLGPGQSVLDFGCGPGINSRLFENHRYVGVDINPAYTEYAARKYGKPFIAADLCAEFNPSEKYDWVLMNSFFHHIPDDKVLRILASAKRALKPGGHALLIDAVLPPEGLVARTLARLDRGQFMRPRPVLESLAGQVFDFKKNYAFRIGFFGVTCWEMVAFVLEAKK